jgi:hypothetical protein
MINLKGSFMRHRLFLFLLIIGLPGILFAENNLNITKFDGSRQYSPVSQIRKLTFSSTGDVLQIGLLSGQVVSDSIGWIRKIAFDTSGFGTMLAVPTASRRSPAMFALAQNYPNPFNPATTIRYNVPEKQFVSLKVYNVLGEVVSTLVSEEKSAGQHIVTFDAGAISSGVYFYTLTMGNAGISKKMIVTK